MKDQKSTSTRVASSAERHNNDWVKARPADEQRHDAIQATVTTEQALLDAYPGSAASLATLAATLGIAWALTDTFESDD